MGDSIDKVDRYEDSEGRSVEVLTPLDKSRGGKVFRGVAHAVAGTGQRMPFVFEFPPQVKSVRDAFRVFDDVAVKELDQIVAEQRRAEEEAQARASKGEARTRAQDAGIILPGNIPLDMLKNGGEGGG